MRAQPRMRRRHQHHTPTPTPAPLLPLPTHAHAPCSYWFLAEAYPLATGRHVVRTPAWLSCACLCYGFGRVPMAAVNPVNPSDVRFRAFQGRARRLAD